MGEWIWTYALGVALTLSRRAAPPGLQTRGDTDAMPGRGGEG